ncbi:hypothetical protein [Salmonella phage SD-1_S14]|nr:hypothetical protein [Salmonella phage SD-1_S14]
MSRLTSTPPVNLTLYVKLKASPDSTNGTTCSYVFNITRSSLTKLYITISQVFTPISSNVGALSTITSFTVFATCLASAAYTLKLKSTKIILKKILFLLYILILFYMSYRVVLVYYF